MLIIQLFQLTLSDQSIKVQDKTARLPGIFSEYSRPYSDDLRWCAI